MGEALAQLLAFDPGKILLERFGQLALIHPCSNTSFFSAARLLPRLAIPTCRPETQS